MVKITLTHDKDIDYPLGFSVYTGKSGIKYKRNDTAILLCPEGASFHGVFSKNTFRSLSLDDSISKLGEKIHAVCVFSGNANCATGIHALQSIKILSKAAAACFKTNPRSILLSFTGVIGRPFPAQKILPAFTGLCTAAARAAASRCIPKVPFAEAIMTTDTRVKRASCELIINGKKIRIAGCAKGAGMIAPNMGTMLAYITTDLDIPSNEIKKIIIQAAALSFNSITVDGDTSTNDSFFIFASGKSGVSWNKIKNKNTVIQAINSICGYCAKEIARDGEGATKLITVCAEGARSVSDAQKMVRAVSESLLVKTAAFGCDPNFGRVLMALGNSGAECTPDKTRLYFGSILLYANGKVFPGRVASAADYLKKNSEILIRIHVGAGKACWTGWTCDISYNYVKINGEYTT